MTAKTRTEIEDLKRGWLKDPCWDIEETEGFEAHREELELFHATMRAKWKKERKRPERAHYWERVERVAAHALAGYLGPENPHMRIGWVVADAVALVDEIDRQRKAEEDAP